MNTASLGLIAGLLLGVAAAAGGFTGFLVALVLGAVGYVLGGARDGDDGEGWSIVSGFWMAKRAPADEQPAAEAPATTAAVAVA